MQVTDEMMAASTKAYVAVDGKVRPAALRAALSAALSALVEEQPVATDWHRSDNSMGGVLLYTLREDGWRRGEPVMVNDVTIRIEGASGSEADIEPIVRRIRAALVDVPAVSDHPTSENADAD